MLVPSTFPGKHMKYNCLPKVFPRILFLSRRAYCSLHRIKASQKFIEKKNHKAGTSVFAQLL